MDELYRRHAPAGLSVVAIAVATDQETAEAYAAALALSYPVALDSDGAVFVRYRAFFVPAHYWIDGNGVIRDWAGGEVPPDLLAEAVAKLLATD